MPMYDEVGMLQEAFHFEVVNKTENDINYKLYLKDVTEEGEEKLSYEDVKYYLTKAKTEYAPNGIYKKEGNVVLYAVWVKAKYVISYDANTGINPPASQEKEYGVSTNITNSVPSKTGYTFQ